MSATPDDDARRDSRNGRDSRESVPLLLARAAHRISLGPELPPAKPRPPAEMRSALRAVARTKLGAAGMIVAALLVIVAVFADLLASDLPIVCSIHGHVWVLPAVTHPPELAARGARVCDDASVCVMPLVRHGPTRADEPPAPLLAPGVRGHPLGTDRDGRDVFARMVHGTRSYLVFALFAVLAAVALGAAFGGVAGLFGGATDMVVGRAIETVSAFPPLVLVLGVQAAVPRPTLSTLFLAIAVTRWPEVARLVRAEVLTATTRDYALAARALGASPLRILRRHIAPNVRGPLIVTGALGISAVVLTEASLDFLRIGVPGGAASWGETMSEFRDAPHAWWLLVFPGALLFATVIGHNLAGEGLRDALDPRAR